MKKSALQRAIRKQYRLLPYDLKGWWKIEKNGHVTQFGNGSKASYRRQIERSCEWDLRRIQEARKMLIKIGFEIKPYRVAKSKPMQPDAGGKS